MLPHFNSGLGKTVFSLFQIYFQSKARYIKGKKILQAKKNHEKWDKNLRALYIAATAAASAASRSSQ